MLYNRGVINAMLRRRGDPHRAGKFGKKPLTGEQVRWGLEHLNLDRRPHQGARLRGPDAAAQDHLRRPRGRTAQARIQHGTARSGASSPTGSRPTTRSSTPMVKVGRRRSTPTEKKITAARLREGELSLGSEHALRPAAPKAATPGATCSTCNDIEVIYNHVILVLKGVSLSVPRGRHRRAARRQRRRQDHDAEGDLQPAARASAAR